MPREYGTHHARQRSLQRYGVPLDAEEIIWRVLCEKGRCIERCSDEVSVWSVRMRGRRVHAVINERRGLVITLLPRKGKRGYLHGQCGEDVPV